MVITVSGSTGFVGSALVESLLGQGHEVIRLVRGSREPGEREIAWDPTEGTIDRARLEGLDGVVHLAGENVGKGRWTAEKKARIRKSRVEGTRLLSEALAGLERPPKVLVSASAVGYYGSRGEEILTEESGPGEGFLSEVGREWEEATEPAAGGGIRVVRLRIGVVLHPGGGALRRMLPPFQWGVGGRIGPGTQYMPWISMEDLVGAIRHVLSHEAIAGAVNAVAPGVVTNLEFTKTLGRILRRPTIFPIPAFVARLALGEMADETLLASARVEPRVLLESGYEFRHPGLEAALREILGK